MVFIEQPKTEGETKDCPNCGKPIVARLKEYKDFPNKIQWQDKEQTKAHYDKTGNCQLQQESPIPPRTERDDPQKQLTNITNDEMIARMFDMISQMYRDYCDTKIDEVPS